MWWWFKIITNSIRETFGDKSENSKLFLEICVNHMREWIYLFYNYYFIKDRNTYFLFIIKIIDIQEKFHYSHWRWIEFCKSNQEINPTDIYPFIYLLLISDTIRIPIRMIPSFCILLTATLVTGRFLDILYRSLNYRLLITIWQNSFSYRIFIA